MIFAVIQLYTLIRASKQIIDILTVPHYVTTKSIRIKYHLKVVYTA